MNVITHKAAYSFFPRATFEEKRNLATQHAENTAVLDKYEERGWVTEFGIEPDHQLNLSSSLRYEKRWTRDNKTWIFPFEIKSIGYTDRHEAYDFVETASFDLTMSMQDFMPEVHFAIFKDVRLSSYSFITNMSFAMKLEEMVNVMNTIMPPQTRIPPEV